MRVIIGKKKVRHISIHDNLIDYIHFQLGERQNKNILKVVFVDVKPQIQIKNGLS